MAPVELDANVLGGFDDSSSSEDDEAAAHLRGENADASAEEFLDGAEITSNRNYTMFVIDCRHYSSKQLPERFFQPVLSQARTQSLPEFTLVAASCGDDATYSKGSPGAAAPRVTIWNEVCDSITHYLRTRIMTSPQDKVGIILFGVPSSPDTNQERTTERFPGVRSWQPLDFISAPRIKQIEAAKQLSFVNFVQQFGPPISFKTKLAGTAGSPGQLPETSGAKLSDLLWFVQESFNGLGVSSKRHYRRVFLISAIDDAPSSELEATACVQRGTDLQQDGVEFDCVPLQVPGLDRFDFTKFWKRFILIDTEGLSPETFLETVVTVRDLVFHFRRKEMAQRSLGQLRLHISEGFEIGLELFSSLLEQRLPTPRQLDSEYMLPLNCITRWISATTGEILGVADIRKVMSFGRAMAPISALERQQLHCLNGWGAVTKSLGTAISESKSSEDNNISVTNINRFSEPHLLLLGFKPLRFLKFKQILGHPYFLAANNSRPPTGVSGSSTVLAAMLAAMTRRQVFGVVRGVLRRNRSPILAALVPQLAGSEITPGSAGQSPEPSGFHLIPLPFAESVRKIDTSSSTRKLDNEVDTPSGKRRIQQVEEVLKNLQLSEFDPRVVPNPSLQQYYSTLEALALDKPEADRFVDVTAVAPSGTKTVVEAVLPWSQLLKEACEDSSMLHQTTKKRAGSYADMKSEGPTESKRSRPEMDDELIESKVIKYCNDGNASKLLVPELRKFLQINNLPVSGTKSVLVSRVQNYLEHRTARD